MRPTQVNAPLLLIATLVLAIGLVATSCAPHHHRHRNPENIAEYLEHLDRPERDEYQKPQEVMGALGLKPGMAVADLGSGSGYFTRRFVETVAATGMVYAIDVEPQMLDYVKHSLEQMRIPYRTEFILAQPEGPELPMESVDLVFVCNVYHHLDDRARYFTGVKPSLKSDGRIVVIDFYHDERSGDVGFPKEHLVPKDTVLAEMTNAGYRLIKEHTFLPRQYFLEFAPVASH